MGWMEGMVSGFAGRKAQVEQENMRQSELANAHEAKIYEALINSPDPEIKSMAITGLLDSAKPQKRKGGFRGWLGEMQENPALEHIKNLINTPVTTTETHNTPGLPSVQSSGYLSAIPGQQSSMSMPDGNAVTPGSPGMAQVESNVHSEIVPGPAVGRTDTKQVTKPREVFRSPEDQELLTDEAKARGAVKGRIAGREEAGFSDEEARDLERKQLAGAAPFQAIAGTMPDGSQISAVFDKARGRYVHPVTGEVLDGFVARQTGAQSERFGVNREAIARATYNKPFKDLDQAQASDVMAKEQTYLASSAGSRVSGAGAAKMDVPADLSTAQRTGVDVGTTANSVVGQNVPTIAQQDTQRTVTQVKDELEKIRDTMLDVLPSDHDMIGGLAPGAVMAVRRRDPRYRTQIAQLESAVNNIVNIHARAIGQQRGAQTEKDAMRAEAAITSLHDSLLSGDTKESTTARINESLSYINKVLGMMPHSPTPGAAPVGSPPPGGRPPAGASLDAQAPGYFVDDTGKLIQR